jgi:hypothetical protein
MGFRRHLAAFVGANAALHVLNLFAGDGWWAFWPLVVWAPLLGGHYFVHKSRRVDERWAKERTDDVRSKSYDRAHIDDIAARHTRSDTE